MNKAPLELLQETEDRQLQKLNEIVLKCIEEEKLISEKLYQFDHRDSRLLSRISDRVAAFAGSIYFILSFLVLLIIWIGANAFLLTKPFDVYPFILLNLFLSTIAALQGPVIMMSQNRKEEKDRQRGLNDYMVNLKSEIQVRNIQQKLDLLIFEQMKTLFEIQRSQMEMLDEIRSATEKTSKLDSMVT
jgi:uncharacterized membrane protein